MKGRILIIACVIVAICCVASGTVAFYTKDATATNVITTGKVDLEIVETTDNSVEFPESGVVVLPGATVSKIVSVRNISNHPIYVKLRLAKFVNNDKLQADFMANNVLSTDFNSDDWTASNDGFVYYNKALEAGKETTPVFREVYISGPNTDNNYRGLNFTLQVDAYGVQSENNGSNYSEAAGWPTIPCANESAIFIPNVPAKGGDK